MAQNQFTFDILEDGTIKFKTEAFGPEQHASAEEFLKITADLMGGARTSGMRVDVSIPLTVKPHWHVDANGKKYLHQH